MSDDLPDLGVEADAGDHDVPAELVELHQVLEWDQAVAAAAGQADA